MPGSLSQTEIDVLLKMRAEGQQSIDLFSGTLNKAGQAGTTAAAGVDQGTAAITRSGVAATAAGVALGEFAVKLGQKVLQLGEDTVLTAARTQGLTAVADFLGQRAGKTKDQVDDLISSIKHQGVTTQEASNLVIQLSRANLGLENATKLATVAQNGAFIAGESTAEAIGQIINGIVTLQPELIRSAGITVSLQQAELEYAKAHHTSADALTTSQKQQLLMNAVLKEGERINGVYALSMQYVGKQLTSLPRFIEEAKNAVGNELLPVLGLGVRGFTELLKIITAHPKVFVDLGIAVVAVVGPLLAAKAAALLGVPSFLELAGAVTSAAGAFGVLKGVNTFADLRAGVQLLGEASSITFAKLGLLGTGAAVVAAAFAGWELGRWIASLTGSDEAIGKLTASLLHMGDVEAETAGAKQDVINKAIDAGAASTITYTEAIQFNNAAEERRRATLEHGEKALHDVISEQEKYTVSVDGITMHVGKATDAVHKMWEEIENRKVHAPDLSSLPKPGVEKGITLDPQKDAIDFLTSAMTGNANIAKVVLERARDVNNALSIMGSDGVAKARQGFDQHTISAKDLADAYKIDISVAQAIETKFKAEGEAAKKAGEEQRKWNEILAEANALGDNWVLTLDKMDPASKEAARGYIEQGLALEKVAVLTGLSATQVKAVAKSFELEREASKIALEAEEEDRKKWLEQVKKADADAEAAYMQNYAIFTDSSREAYEIAAHAALSSTDFQIAQIQEWQNYAEGAIDYTQTNWEESYNAVARLAAAKMQEVRRANDPVFVAWKAMNEDMRGDWAQTFEGALNKTISWKDAVLRPFTDLAAGIKKILAGLLADLEAQFLNPFLNKFKQGLAGMLGGHGGGGGGSDFMGPQEEGGGGFGGLGSLFSTKQGQKQLGFGLAVSGGLELLSAHGKVANTLAGAQTGAGIGLMAGGPVGAVIGGGIGAVGGFVKSLFGESQAHKDTVAANKDIGDYQKKLLETYGSLDKIGTLGRQVGIDLAGAWGDQGKKGLEHFKGLAEEFAQKLAELDAVTRQYGVTWSDMNAEARDQGVSDAVAKLLEQQKLLTDAGYKQEAVVKRMAPAWNDLLGAALDSGQAIPPALKPILEQLEKMGLLTDANKKKLLGLSDSAKVDFKALEGVAKDYGIDLAALGPKFQQAHVTDEADKIFADFKALTDAGADVGGVLNGMKDEISKVVQESIKFGTEIPANMKPLIQNLLEAGALTDEQGHKIKDIGGIKFAEPIEKETDRIVDAIERLGDILTGKLPQDARDAAAGVNAGLGNIRPPTVNIHYKYVGDNDLPPIPNGDPGADGGPTYAAQGIFANRPTLAVFGEGGEPELGGPIDFMSKALAGALDRAHGGAAAVTGAGGDTYVFNVTTLDANGLQDAVERQILPLVIDTVRGNRRGARTNFRAAIGVAGS